MLARHRSILGAAVAAAALAAPAVAAADSIVFVQDGNVWSSRPDGSGRVQLTGGGNWHSPTQADDGTIAAVQGVGPIQVLARDGRPLHTIQTPNAATANGGTFAAAPKSLSFTPDGSRIAYTYIQGACPIGSSCSTEQVSTFYTENRPGASTPHDVWGNQFGAGDPEWITNDRALVFGGSGHQVNIDPLGGGDYSYVNWMKPSADQGDGELSRDMRRLATTFFHGPDKIIALFAVTGDPRTESPPAQPAVACQLSPGDAHFGDPSWSPDGSGLAFRTVKGVEVLRFTAFGAGTCETTGDSFLLAPGASEPDWGPADPPAAAWTPPGAGGGGSAPGTSTPPPSTGTPRGGGRTLSIKAGGAATQRLRRGAFSVTCTAPSAGRCSAGAVVKVGRRTYRTSAASQVRKGVATKLTLRFGARARKALGRALRRKRLKAAVTLTFTGGGARGTSTRTVTLTR